MQKIYEFISKNIAILSTFFLCGGLLDDWLYYKSFGIEIFTYLTFTDVITRFVDKIPVLLLIVIVSSIYIFIIEVIFKNKIDRILNVRGMNAQRRRLAGAYNHLVLAILLLIWMLYLVVLPMISLKFYKSESSFFIKLFIMYGFIFWLFMGLAREYNLSYPKRYFYLSIVLFFISIYYSVNYKVFSLNLKEKQFPNVFIEMKNNEVLQSSDSLIYIGKTQHYIFIHKRIKEKSYSRIMNIDDIKNFRIHKYVDTFWPF